MMTTALPPDASAPYSAPEALRFGAELRRNGVSAYRKSYGIADKLQLTGPASRTGFLLGVSMTDRHRRTITKGELTGTHDFSRGDIYLRDLEAPCLAEVDAPFDFTLFEFSAGFFDTLADEHVNPSAVAFNPIAAQRDPILANLTYALLPSLARPSQACHLFVEQIFSAMAAYLVHTFGGVASAAVQPRALSLAHEDRAKAMLLSKVRGEYAIPDIARECNMSTSYFMKAFKMSTGKTPHQWMMSERLAMARDYLRNSTLSLAEVATSCDFYDQSHFNRVFTQSMGLSPGAWRRQAA